MCCGQLCVRCLPFALLVWLLFTSYYFVMQIVSQYLPIEPRKGDTCRCCANVYVSMNNIKYLLQNLGHCVEMFQMLSAQYNVTLHVNAASH